MKNAEQPITPIFNIEGKPTDLYSTAHKTNSIGLTKREYFAGIAMQGLISGQLGTAEIETVVKASVVYADAILKALEQK